MEMMYERCQRKTLRRSFSVIGWILLIYNAILNLSVWLSVFLEAVAGVVQALRLGRADMAVDVVLEASENAWGYFLAIGVGLLILLCWKKRRFWKEEIWAYGKPMTASRFFAILSVFISGQLIYQILVMVAETVLNLFGLSVMDGLSSMAIDSNNFGMFLYAGILAPISEEILFRGLIQKTLMPYGKKFAIIMSAFAFGIFHGELFQSSYAFLVGLVLGYVAAEYSIGWSMVLHMINNLVIADMLERLTVGLPDAVTALLVWGILLVFTVAAVVILLVKRRQIMAYGEELNRLYVKCFFTSPGMMILMILMGLSMIYSLFLMIAPL